MQTAFIFPGQGSQYVGMSGGWLAAHPEARETLAEADDALGERLSALIADGPVEALTLTENTQPAILTISIAQLRVLRARRPDAGPVAAAGHSLGEYSALVAAGSLDFADAVRLVRLRGRAMQEAVPVGEGTMAAVRGLDPEAVRAACAAAADRGLVEVAAINSPGQIVIAGRCAAVDAALEAASAAGASAAVKLNVSAPFHCGLLAPAGERLALALAEIPLRAPNFPVLQNVDGEAHADPEVIRTKLIAQVSRPVQWEDCARGLIAAGAERMIEIGPGRTLAGLQRRISRGTPVISLDRAGALEAL